MAKWQRHRAKGQRQVVEVLERRTSNAQLSTSKLRKRKATAVWPEAKNSV